MSISGSILVVCTGNLCRSPYIERRLRQALEGTEITITSAGTTAVVGEPMDRESAILVEGSGGQARDFRAQQLQPELIAPADLVLAAAREHRSAVVRMHPPALRTAMTIRDLADLLTGVTASDVRDQDLPGTWVSQVLTVAQSRRSLVPARQSGVDITDPIGRSRGAFERMSDEVESALRVIVPVLRGPVED
ncbi:low molecular weight phosphatase family protein [Nostocoides sp. F2B08]|uniref:arsenate reductase/protein-tyrosine-phosphatase family protein n=1 Tax=Nostocoides sp. F2B08 TaxID=2653936 RepID=UPI00186B262E|nr:low molecular weight phosphatase family protein [Tetrasphaera sp. F2B08]